MASQAQITANRLNARKSTGPRTAEGKEKVSQNAVTHGLTGRRAVIRGEDPDEFALYRDAMVDELAPAGAIEAMLADRIVGLSWRLRRAERLQNDAFDLLYLKEATDSSSDAVRLGKEMGPNGYYHALGPVQEDLVAGRVIVRDFGGGRAFERLLMYERRIEQSLYKAMAELRKLQKARAYAHRPAETPTRKPASTGQEDLMCKTNPIPGMPGEEPEWMAQNKANSPASRPEGEYGLCETKPIAGAEIDPAPVAAGRS